MNTLTDAQMVKVLKQELAIQAMAFDGKMKNVAEQVGEIMKMVRPDEKIEDNHNKCEYLLNRIENLQKANTLIGKDYENLLNELTRLRSEVDCRISHGAESNGHLEYVRDAIDRIRGQFKVNGL